MLDEFPALGRLDFFESALAFVAGYGLRSFLIAQSLNQIEKAYGPNNSILDNCHVRIAFATNDERTAKRISDALGTATELRAQRNYAGHRLSPWLGHLMVSRQETARPLLTPGEVMQLPDHQEIVMVSGHPPAKADKIRYYADANFTSRVLAAPILGNNGYADRPAVRADDWTGLARPKTPAVRAAAAASGPDEGGHQIAPQLDDAEIVRLHDRPRDDLAVLDDEAADTGTRDGRLPQPAQQFRRTARLAALDPDDGIAL
jgi:type IV secretion system protein VirD4